MLSFDYDKHCIEFSNKLKPDHLLSGTDFQFYVIKRRKDKYPKHCLMKSMVLPKQSHDEGYSIRPLLMQKTIAQSTH